MPKNDADDFIFLFYLKTSSQLINEIDLQVHKAFPPNEPHVDAHQGKEPRVWSVQQSVRSS